MSATALRVALGLATALLAGAIAASCTNDPYCFDCTDGGGSTGSGGSGGADGGADCNLVGCESGQACCEAVCTDIESDSNNCGGCFNSCVGANAVGSCSGGKCMFDCATDYADCNHLGSDGCETNVGSDPENCGGCGKTCMIAHDDPTCAAGKCVFGPCVTGYADCNKNPADGCEIDLANDPANCTSCGHVCVPTPNVVPTCVVGICGGTDCVLGFADCDGMPASGCEVDLLTDVENCSACGLACPALYEAMPGCVNGACAIGSCDAGYADCDHSVYDGCEVELATDTNNCSACGRVCPAVANGTPGCAMGTCGVGGCDPGYADCDGNPQNGCETNLANDPMNCGACTVTCPAVDNGTPACAGFACGIGSCEAGFANCFGGVATGCSTDLLTDVNNCSACGASCPAVANGSRGCTGGMCGIASCETGYADCDMMLADGCEANLATDVQNCGRCQNPCPVPPNGVAGCAAGACTLASCDAGFSNCDGNPANGCERNTGNDPDNCGGCGITCGSGKCVNSACVCTKSVLLIEDDSPTGTTTLGTALKAAGFAVTQTAVPSYQYNGTNPAPTGFGAVLVLAGGPQATSYSTDMPPAGQAAIVAFSNAGNGVVFTEWAAYQVLNGRWQALAPLVLLTRTTEYTGQTTYTVDPAFAMHPIWAGLPATFTFASTSNSGITKLGPGITRIAGSPQAIDAVAIRDVPVGRVVHVAHAGNYAPNGWTDVTVQALMANAVGWVARCE